MNCIDIDYLSGSESYNVYRYLSIHRLAGVPLIMEQGKTIVGFLLFLLGGLNVVKPEIYIKFQTWVFKTIYGADFKPSAKTVKVNKFMGVVLVFMGLLLIVG